MANSRLTQKVHNAHQRNFAAAQDRELCCLLQQAVLTLVEGCLRPQEKLWGLVSHAAFRGETSKLSRYSSLSHLSAPVYSCRLRCALS